MVTPPRRPGRRAGDELGSAPPRLPQMPAYHLVRPDGAGITMVNIGIGPANAKTITDHIAVLRPHAWIMLGHCAGLRNTQQLGDYVLAHGYVREDHVLDEDLPLWVPIPALAEVQVALEAAVAEITQFKGYELKRIMRTGTVASTDNRNWELLPHRGPERRFSQSRAIALDMESATIAANGFRFRVPYGTLLCVSDKPLHGEIKLPGMANQFYRERVDQHLRIGMRAVELLREAGVDQLHSRKLQELRRSGVPVAGARPRVRCRRSGSATRRRPRERPGVWLSSRLTRHDPQGPPMPSPLPNGTTSIRTLALVGPAAAGKTSLAEALLCRAGAIGAPGSLERGSTVSDFDPLERQGAAFAEHGADAHAPRRHPHPPDRHPGHARLPRPVAAGAGSGRDGGGGDRRSDRHRDDGRADDELCGTARALPHDHRQQDRRRRTSTWRAWWRRSRPRSARSACR